MKTVLSLLFVFAVLVLSPSCKHKNTDSHLPPELMCKVLVDVNLAESYSTLAKDSLHKSGKNMDSLSTWYKDIFAHYKITDAQFTSSLNWYKDHPEEIDSLYGAMQLAVTRLQGTPALKKN